MANPTFPLRNEMDRQRAIEMLHECLEVRDGVLVWKHRPINHFATARAFSSWNAKFAGTVAGSTDSKGYTQIKIFGRLVLAHRIVWLMAKGTWPECLDHVDGNPQNNDIANLREVSHQSNMRNQKRRCDNKSGVMGVHWLKAKGRWIAKIQNAHLGTFETLLDACAAKKSAELSLAFHRNHGRVA